MKKSTYDQFSVVTLRATLIELKNNRAVIQGKFNRVKKDLLGNTNLGYYELNEKMELLKNHHALILSSTQEISLITEILKKNDIDFETCQKPELNILNKE